MRRIKWWILLWIVKLTPNSRSKLIRSSTQDDFLSKALENVLASSVIPSSIMILIIFCKGYVHELCTQGSLICCHNVRTKAPIMTIYTNFSCMDYWDRTHDSRIASRLTNVISRKMKNYQAMIPAKEVDLFSISIIQKEIQEMATSSASIVANNSIWAISGNDHLIKRHMLHPNLTTL